MKTKPSVRLIMVVLKQRAIYWRTHGKKFWCLSCVTISIANSTDDPQDAVSEELLVSIFREGAECKVRHPSYTSEKIRVIGLACRRGDSISALHLSSCH